MAERYNINYVLHNQELHGAKVEFSEEIAKELGFPCHTMMSVTAPSKDAARMACFVVEYHFGQFYQQLGGRDA